jgi:exosome complex RNA-binding protein Rrp42 (RNase PH superfamily)
MVVRGGLVANANARFVASALAAGERFDGRTVLEQRPTSCEFPEIQQPSLAAKGGGAGAGAAPSAAPVGVVASNVARTLDGHMALPVVAHANGVVTVCAGRSAATCVVTAAVAEPNADRPAEGTISIKVDVPPHARFEPGHTRCVIVPINVTAHSLDTTRVCNSFKSLVCCFYQWVAPPLFFYLFIIVFFFFFFFFFF